MSIKERKEKEKEQMTNLILDAASTIISNEGIEQLSIRKIAKIIDYSPTIIYHYFKDKDDIIYQFVGKKYLEIIKNVVDQNSNCIDLIDKLKGMLYTYIKGALENPEIYKVVMLSSNKDVIKHTSVLFREDSSRTKLMNIFYELIEQIINKNDLGSISIDSILQIVWTSTYGLIIRLIIENQVSKEEKEKVIKTHIEMIINRVILNKKL